MIAILKRHARISNNSYVSIWPLPLYPFGGLKADPYLRTSREVRIRLGNVVKMPSCTGCQKNTTVKCPFTNAILCRPCVKNISITYTDAKKLYEIVDADLATLPVWTFRTQSGNARRFRVADIESIAPLRTVAQAVNPTKELVYKTLGIEQSESASLFADRWIDYKNRLHGVKVGWKRYQQCIQIWPDHILWDYVFDFSGVNENIIKQKKEVYLMLQELNIRMNEFDDTHRFNCVFKKFYDGVVSNVELRAFLEMYCERKQTLALALEAKGLQLRSDSVLCKEYCMGDDDMSIGDIVKIMYKMDFLHRYTDYRNIYKRLMDDAVKNGGWHFGELFILRSITSDKAQKEALDRAPKHIKDDYHAKMSLDL